MIRFLSALAIFGFAAAPLSASAQPAMWTLNDADTTIHIFGTIHALPEDLEWRTDAFDTAFESADTFCVETDVEEKIFEVMDLTFDEGMFTGDERLSDHLTDQETEELHEIAEAVGIVPISVELMKPWHAMLNISSAVGVMVGLDEDSGVEFVLLPEARASGKTICEMESPAEHIQSLSRLPMEVQVAALTYVPEELEDMDSIDEMIEYSRKEIDEMVTEWAAGDVEAIGDDEPEDYGHPDFYEAIMVKRNQMWIPRIEALLDDPGVKFIAVGAGHLAGPDSVILMLRDKGYEVEGP